MEIIQIILATMVTLGILISVHEFGHFWIARRCGVKVLKFSIGFGKPIFKWSDKLGTEYIIALIPLGGYVKMLDEREGEVADNDLSFAFNRKSVGKRIAIVIAGPAANFLFAICVYWLIFTMGVTSIVPVIGSIHPGSVAEKAGMTPDYEITAIDGVQTNSWQNINIKLFAHMGETGVIKIQTRSVQDMSTKVHSLMLQNIISNNEQPNLLYDLGIEPFMPIIPAKLGQIMPNSAAAKAGLQVDDMIITADGIPINDWNTLVRIVMEHPQKPIQLELERQGQRIIKLVTPSLKVTDKDEHIGYLGVRAVGVDWPDAMQREISYPIYLAWMPAIQKTWNMSALTIISLKKMIVGLISVKNLSGPITIAKVAGASANNGVETFLNFLAYISISLGIINIMPIPVLDGGHLLYYFAELVRGKPIPEKIQLIGFKVGAAIIASLMFIAIYNDLARL